MDNERCKGFPWVGIRWMDHLIEEHDVDPMDDRWLTWSRRNWVEWHMIQISKKEENA